MTFPMGWHSTICPASEPPVGSRPCACGFDAQRALAANGVANESSYTVIDGEEARTRAEAERDVALQALWDAWAALGYDTDGDTSPVHLIAGMGVEGFARMVVRDAAAHRKESEDDYEADTDRLERERDEALAKVARVQALIDSADGWRMPVWAVDLALHRNTEVQP